MSSHPRKVLALAWAALAGAGLAWLAAHQLGSNLTISDCRMSGAVPVLLIGLLALLLIAASAALSWRIWRRRGGESGHGFAALLGIGSAGLFAFAILLQTVAAFIIPSCWG